MSRSMKCIGWIGLSLLLGAPAVVWADADVALTESVAPNPASTGVDIVFTMIATNNGPDTAAGVTVTAAYDSTATVVWASSGCAHSNGAFYVCNIGTLAAGSSRQFRLVLRKDAAGSTYNNAGLNSTSVDPNSSNNTPTLNLNVNQSTSGSPTPLYRLSNTSSGEHLYTTDANEYNTLPAPWVKEGTVGELLNAPGSWGGVDSLAAVPYYRLYNTSTTFHLWTADPNEYYTLTDKASPSDSTTWNGEGIIGFIVPAATPCTQSLYRLNNGNLYLLTIDANEYNTLGSEGWTQEGIAGYTIQSQCTPPQLYYIHADQLGTPREISRASDNQIVWRWDNTEPFGNSQPNENPSGLGPFTYNLRFPGQYFDAETGTYYNYFRDYDPSIGRYVESDPVGLRGGINTYAYVRSRPLLLVDPFGLKARVCCRGIPATGNLAGHCYIETDGPAPAGGSRRGQGSNGKLTYGLFGGPGSGVASGIGQTFIGDAFDVGGSCGDWNEGCDTNDCVAKAAGNYPNPSHYNLGGPNSNTFASQIAKQCKLKEPPNPYWTPGWGWAQAPSAEGYGRSPINTAPLPPLRSGPQDPFSSGGGG